MTTQKLKKHKQTKKKYNLPLASVASPQNIDYEMTMVHVAES
jgi:hypothetical protein